MAEVKKKKRKIIKTDAADRHFSRLVRMRANWTCQRCGKYHGHNTGALDCSHFYGRGSRSTRWHADNAVAHCYGCHSYLGSRAIEFNKFMRELRGDEVVDRLEYLHHLRVKVTESDIKDITADLREQVKVMELGEDFETPATILLAIQEAERRRGV